MDKQYNSLQEILCRKKNINKKFRLYLIDSYDKYNITFTDPEIIENKNKFKLIKEYEENIFYYKNTCIINDDCFEFNYRCELLCDNILLSKVKLKKISNDCVPYLSKYNFEEVVKCKKYYVDKNINLIITNNLCYYEIENKNVDLSKLKLL